MTRQRKLPKKYLCSNAYHPSERDICNIASRVESVKIIEHFSSQSTDTEDFDPEDSANSLLGTLKILSIKTCDQDGCPIVLSFTDSDVLTCSCSEEEYTYLYQILIDQDLNLLDVYRTDLFNVKDTDMVFSHRKVIHLKKSNKLMEHIIDLQQEEKYIFLAKGIYTQNATISLYTEEQTASESSIKGLYAKDVSRPTNEILKKFSADNILTQTASLPFHTREKTELTSTLEGPDAQDVSKQEDQSEKNISAENMTIPATKIPLHIDKQAELTSTLEGPHAKDVFQQEDQPERNLSKHNISTQNITIPNHTDEQTESTSSLKGPYSKDEFNQKDLSEKKLLIHNITTQNITLQPHTDERAELTSSLRGPYSKDEFNQEDQSERKLSEDNISALKYNIADQSKFKLFLDIISEHLEELQEVLDKKAKAKEETVISYITARILLTFRDFKTMEELIQQHKLRKSLSSMLQTATRLDILTFIKSGFDDNVADIVSSTVKFHKHERFLDLFSSTSTSTSISYLKSLADNNNKQKENKKLQEKKSKEDNEKGKFKNLTGLHLTHCDTELKTDEANKDIDLKDKTKVQGMRSIKKMKGPVSLCADKKEKETPCVAEWDINRKTPVLYVSDIELLRHLTQNEFSEGNQQDKITKEFLMQIINHGYGRFRRGRMSLRPLTHTEMNMFLDMDIYLNRVSTFVDWPNKSISSLQLAKAGFIYEGQGQEIRCFSCGLAISDFPAEFVPLNYHHAESNNCNFLKSLESNDASEIENTLLHDSVSNGQTDEKNQPHIQNMYSQTDEDFSNDNVLDSILAADKTQARNNGLDSSYNLQPTRTHTDIGERSVKGKHRNISLNWSVDNNCNLSDNILGSAKHPQFIGIHNRLKSFIDWSHGHIKEPRHFVEAGFYFTGREDIVRCFFCDIGLAEWISEDDPWVEHARYSPNCLFVIEKRGHEFVESIQREWRQIYCPKNNEFEEFGARIRSFSNWPLYIIQRPEQLASAGFYYTGKSDEVRCHYCTGGLKGWEEGDEPWSEHARWFPACKFLIKSKGSSYIEEIARKYNHDNLTKGSRRTRGRNDQSRTEPRNNSQSLDNGSNPEAAKHSQQMKNELIRETTNLVKEVEEIDIETASEIMISFYY